MKMGTYLDSHLRSVFESEELVPGSHPISSPDQPHSLSRQNPGTSFASEQPFLSKQTKALRSV